MLFQQKAMAPPVADPSQVSDTARQQQAMGTLFSVLFAVMFYHFPSGVNIYWISTSLLGILQQWWGNRNPVTAPVPAVKPNKK